MSESLSIETLILVAVWADPAVFQGVFKITPQSAATESLLLFFRSEYVKKYQHDRVDEFFHFDDYHFSHLYNEVRLIHLSQAKVGSEYAEYVLKYALHKTLLEMQMNQQRKGVVVDDAAMNAMIKRVEPMLKQEGTWIVPDEDLGFAASIDFYPQETMGQLAVEILLHLKDDESQHLGSVIN